MECKPGYENLVVFLDGHVETVMFFKRYVKKGNHGIVVDFFTESGKYRYIAPIRSINEPSGYLLHHYYKSVIDISDTGEVTEKWERCNVIQACFLTNFVDNEEV